MKLRLVMSGGQTGADLTALEEAHKRGIKTGGHCPRGCRTDVGPNRELVTKYGLAETADNGYKTRTRLNVKESEITIWFGYTGSPGYKCTKRACQDFGKILIDNPTPEAFKALADTYEVINVAGNRARMNPDVVAQVREAFSWL